jgi:pimeloyl-ACP methyl ester carboxylesterase
MVEHGGASGSAAGPLEDWLPGRRISLRGRKKVVFATGVMSRSGEALRQFGGFSRYLENNFGYSGGGPTGGDFLEVSYDSVPVGGGWRPAPYEPRHCEVTLTQAVDQVGRSLGWYRARLPDDTSYHLIGYSLGGVAIFEAAVRLLETEPGRWQGRLGSLITLSAPLFGADLGPEGDLLGVLGFGVLVPGGQAVRELIARGRNPAHRAEVERRAARLRAAGVRLLTLADAEDVVVTPEDAIIAAPSERERYVLAGPRVPLGEPGNTPFGHGPLLRNTLAWVRMARLIGAQEPRLP